MSQMADDAPHNSHILTPVDAERMLADTLRRLDEETTEFREIQYFAATAEADYRKAKGLKAIAIMRGQHSSAKARDARIELELDPERREHLTAQAALHSARESLVTLRARLAALQVISASVRTQT